MNARFLAVPALALAFLGAGCTPPAPINGVPVTDAGPQDGRTLTAAQTDATWETYQNARLGFSFQYPTKGKYAPEWEVEVGGSSSCLESQDVGHTAEDTSFCVIGTREGAAGSTYFTHTYRTILKETSVSIIFTKKAIMADIGDCKKAPGQNYWSQYATPQSCIPFSEEEYKKTLDGIVGTFNVK